MCQIYFITIVIILTNAQSMFSFCGKAIVNTHNHPIGIHWARLNRKKTRSSFVYYWNIFRGM